MRKIISALFLLVSLATAHAQAPPAVPGLPDTERRTSYTISGTTCACAVNMALYGDSTDYQNWVEVFINGVRVNYNDATYGWTITSPTGPLATIPRPITNAVLTFTNAQTGTIQIVGARRPRRVSQFSENRGVTARDLNQVLTDIIAQNREIWDKTNDVTGRAILGLPGETLNLLPAASVRAGGYLAFDGGGSPIVAGGGIGSGNVVGAAPSVTGHVPAYSGTGGNAIADSGYFPVQPVTCSASQWVNLIATSGAASCAQPAFSNISGQATLAQLPTIGANTALCSIAGGTPIACTQAQLTSLVNLATASLPGAAPAFPNNTTTFLRGDGTYAAPTASAMVLLNTLTASNSVTLSDLTSFTSTYSSYEIVWTNIIPATNSQTLLFQVHSGGAFKSSGYLCAISGQTFAAGAGSFSSTAGILMGPTTALFNGAPGSSGRLRIYNPSANQISQITGEVSYAASGSTGGLGVVGGYWNTAGVIDGFQVSSSSGNLTSGTIKIYGVQ